MNKIEESVNLFISGCACSQAILTVYGAEYGLENDMAMKLAAGFAAGMRKGETCGAVTGALMVLGLRHSGNECRTAGGRSQVYAAARDFQCRFAQRNGSTICKEILGCDLGTPEGMKEAEGRDLFKTICPKMVKDAAEILEEMVG